MKIGNNFIDEEKIQMNLDFFRVEGCKKCGARRIFIITKQGLKQKEINQNKECKKHKWNYIFQYISPTLKEECLFFGKTCVELKNYIAGGEE